MRAQATVRTDMLHLRRLFAVALGFGLKNVIENMPMYRPRSSTGAMSLTTACMIGACISSPVVHTMIRITPCRKLEPSLATNNCKNMKGSRRLFIL